MAATHLLDYAGADPLHPRTLLGTMGWAIRFTIVLAILIVFVTLRAALLLCGVTCVFLGTVLLMLGGKRDAARRLAAWRERSLDLMSLWWSDLTRPLRRHRRTTPSQPAVPIPVLPQ